MARTKTRIVPLLTLALAFGSASFAQAAPGPEAVRAEITRTLGAVPVFFAGFPEAGLEGAWEAFRDLQLNPNTALPGKTKELIGLAVAAQIPCSYCVYAHTEAARLNGATDVEIHEALAMAALTRQWSTVINGNMIAMDDFRREIDAAFAHAPAARGGEEPVPTSPATGTYRDIEAAFGLVPGFLRAYPEVGVAGAWKEFAGVQLGSQTALSGKVKELIGLGVAAQVPCSFCVYAHTKAARLNGATDAEIQEAVGMAALTRHWSTYLNGLTPDPAAFRAEIDAMFRFVQSRATMAAQTP